MLGNAAGFFTVADPRIAEDLLRKAQALDPGNPKWSERLGHLHSLDALVATSQVKREAAVKALVELERSFDTSTNDAQKYSLLSQLARTAFQAGELKKAQFYAIDLLERAGRDRESWNRGNAIHHGNVVLGRIALRWGDIKKAKEHLIAAGRSPGSPQLSSFGPNMALARDLLRRGEKPVVLDYLNLCGRLWKGHQEVLAAWKAAVTAGRIPTFYAYQLD